MTKQLLRFAFKSYPMQVFTIFLLTLSHAVLTGVGLGLLLPIIEALQPPSNITPTHPLSRFFIGILTYLDLPVTLAVLFIIGLTLYILQSFLQYWRVNLVAKTSSGVEAKIRIELFSSLFDANIGYFYQKKMGDLVNGVVTETHRGAKAFMHLINTFVAVGLVMAYLALATIISWKLTLVLYLLVVPLIYLTRHREGILEKGQEITRANDVLQSVTVESLLGIREIKIFGLESGSKDVFSRSANDLSRLNWLLQRLDARFKCAYDVVAVGVLVVVVILSFFVLTVPVAEMVAFLAVLLRLSPAVTNAQSNRDKFLGTLPGFERVEKLLRETGQYEKETVGSGSKQDLFQSSIVFENVSFAYDGNNVPVLKNISLRLQRGKTTAIVGASGAGKSTLVDLIVRFYDPTSGQIMVDGTDLREIALPAWRKMIGFVSQDTFLFNDSVFTNICYGSLNAAKDKVVEAAKRAYAHEFIVDLPEGYHTVIGDRGVKLSGGERQRLALARSILRDPQILILDEATSDLDSKSEQLIQDSLREMSWNRAVIVIAHRLSTIENADEIIVLEDGRVVEKGNHQMLLQAGRYYAQYYELQFWKGMQAKRAEGETLCEDD